MAVGLGPCGDAFSNQIKTVCNRCVLPEANGRVEHHFEEPFSSSVTQLDVSQIACGRCGLAILICGSSISTHRLVT